MLGERLPECGTDGLGVQLDDQLLVGLRLIRSRVVEDSRCDRERFRERARIEQGGHNRVLAVEGVHVLREEVLLDQVLVRVQAVVEAHAERDGWTAEELIQHRRVDVRPAAEERVQGVHRLLRSTEVAGANSDPGIVSKMRDDLLTIALEGLKLPRSQIVLQQRQGEGGDVLELLQIRLRHPADDRREQAERVAVGDDDDFADVCDAGVDLRRQ